jgi:hypothetical protein
MKTTKKMINRNFLTILRHWEVLPITLLALILLFALSCTRKTNKESSTPQKDILIGAYFFDGWSGKNRYADDPNQPWAVNAPTHLTKRFVEEFQEREPLWGWRGDVQEIVEKQIDLAADNGIDFFLFCWYWRDNKGAINREAIENASLHTQMHMYLKAKNKERLKFALLVDNHGGSEIVGADNWEAAARYWMKYFNDEQHVMVDGKPLVVIFNSAGIDKESTDRMQQVAIENGFPGMVIAGCGNPSPEVGFTHRTHYNIVPGYAEGSEEHDYSELVEAHKQNWIGTEEMPYIPEVTVGWDKRPWEGPDGLHQKEGWYYPNHTPEQVENFLRDAVTWMDENPTKTTKERIVLLYAWNENGEGGYLMPTKGDPNGEFLQAIKRVADERTK